MADVVVFQYDSDGSDSQESSEEAELRRKKIEALKVSVQGTYSYGIHILKHETLIIRL